MFRMINAIWTQWLKNSTQEQWTKIVEIVDDKKNKTEKSKKK